MGKPPRRFSLTCSIARRSPMRSLPLRISSITHERPRDGINRHLAHNDLSKPTYQIQSTV